MHDEMTSPPIQETRQDISALRRLTCLLDRGWRVIATAIAFSTFGVGGLFLWLVFFPLLGLVVRDRAHKARLARYSVHLAFKAFIELMRVLGILRYRITGLEKLNRQGLLILANHPTLIDVVFLISLVPNANCVVKAALASNPFTRGAVQATNYICNDSGAELVEACAHSVRDGNNLIIFPEGTRTAVGGTPALQRGAANIALRGDIDITPVLIRCEPLSLTKGLPWWKVPPSRMNFSIEIRDDMPVAPFMEAANGEASLAARRLTRHLQHYFTVEKPAHAGA